VTLLGVAWPPAGIAGFAVITLVYAAESTRFG
jgi:hypothetical protein